MQFKPEVWVFFYCNSKSFKNQINPLPTIHLTEIS